MKFFCLISVCLCCTVCSAATDRKGDVTWRKIVDGDYAIPVAVIFIKDLGNGTFSHELLLESSEGIYTLPYVSWKKLNQHEQEAINMTIKDNKPFPTKIIAQKLGLDLSMTSGGEQARFVKDLEGNLPLFFVTLNRNQHVQDLTWVGFDSKKDRDVIGVQFLYPMINEFVETRRWIPNEILQKMDSVINNFSKALSMLAKI